jgi:type IV pilus assembly protein PilE
MTLILGKRHPDRCPALPTRQPRGPQAIMKIQTGFTLIELMIAMAIVGILAAVAVPMYKDYVIRARIPDATSALSMRRVMMEQYFQDNRSWANAAGNTPACPATASPDTATSKSFDFSCTANATTYTLTATGKAQMLGLNFTIDQANTMATTATSSAPSGWSGNAGCWITKKGGVC